MAGDRNDYRPIAQESNKAFLQINGKPILQHMLEELRAVVPVKRVFIVGPKEKLEAHVAEQFPNYPKPIQIYEQKNDLLDNANVPLLATPEDDGPDRIVFYLPCDTPLMTAEEINQFLERADMSKYDFVTGLCEEKAMSNFAPTDDKPGITMELFSLREGRFRVNNMHVVRPSAISRMDYIREIYSMRYQLKFINGLKLAAGLLTSSAGVIGMVYYLGLRLSHNLRHMGLLKASRWVERTFLPMGRGERGISKLLGGTYKCVETDLGGAAIDCDNETDYATICQRYDEWMSKLKVKARRDMHLIHG